MGLIRSAYPMVRCYRRNTHTFTALLPQRSQLRFDIGDLGLLGLVFLPSIEKRLENEHTTTRRSSSDRKTSFWRDSTADPASLNLKGLEKALWLRLLDEKVSYQTGKHINTQTL